MKEPPIKKVYSWANPLWDETNVAEISGATKRPINRKISNRHT